MKAGMSLRNVSFAMLGIFIVSCLGWFFWQKQADKLPDGFLLASGRIEGRNINVSSRVQGRIQSLDADEGSAVKKGQVLARLDSEQTLAQVSGAQESFKIAQRQFEQAKLDLDYARQNSSATIWAAQASVDNAMSQLAKATAVEEIAQRNYQRYLQLYQEGAVSAYEFDTRRLAYDSSKADVAALAQAHEVAKANLAAALASSVAVDVKQKQLEASQANINATLAKVQELMANQQELQVVAPIDGTIIVRPVEIGQVVNAVAPLFVMVDLDNIYMKIYIPEPQIGKVHLGGDARVYVDAYPNRHFMGKITKISDQAQFTPKNVETKEERVKLVFAVEVSIDNVDHLLKPGMPGDVLLRWKEDVPWITPK